jgi:hypothetical protein
MGPGPPGPPPALAIGLGQQGLGENSLEGGGELEPDLLLLAGREDVDDAVHGLGGDEVAGDGVYSIQMKLGPGDMTSGPHYFELVARDKAGEKIRSFLTQMKIRFHIRKAKSKSNLFLLYQLEPLRL